MTAVRRLPALRALRRAAIDAEREELVRWRDAGHELPGEPAELALPMVSVMQGIVVQQSLVGDVDLDAYVDTWCALMRAAGFGDQG